MSRTIATGIDVGTTAVKAVIAEYVRTERGPERRIIGTGACESSGLRHGYAVDVGQTVKSVRAAIAEAEKTAGVRVNSALVSVGGIGLEAFTANGTTAISRADAEITDLDLDRVLAACREALPDAAKHNRKTLHTIPLSYKLDGKEVLGRVLGMRGMKLEMKTLFVTVFDQHLADLIEAVEEAGVEVLDVCASPIASAVATLTKAQRVAGCVLADIGSETVSIIVYENDTPISIKIFDIGSNSITNDIALGLRISIEEAEAIKVGTSVPLSQPKKKIDEIINARMEEIFDLIEAHLKKLGKNGLLPAGIVLAGGGSRVDGIEDIAKDALAIPSRAGNISINAARGGNVPDPSWTTAYGLALLGLTPGITSGSDFPSLKKFPGMSSLGNSLKDWARRFLP